MIIALDDYRDHLGADIVCRNYAAMVIVCTNLATSSEPPRLWRHTLIVDHDLGDREPKSGYDFMCWLEERIKIDGWIPPNKIVCCSDNPSGRKRIEQVITSIEEFFTGPLGE